MKAQKLVSLFLLALVVVGCLPIQPQAPESYGLPLATPKITIPVNELPPMLTETPTPIPDPTKGEHLPMPTYPPGLQSLIDKASGDLTNRLLIAITEIQVREAGAVVWPDSSLGCPQMGMAYTEILTPGYRIVLEHAGNQYEYHAGRGGEVFYCPNPTPPVPGTPNGI